MKRSHQVALLLMGTVAVGGGAYALMPHENCPPNQPGAQQPQDPNCRPRSSSSGSGGHGYYGGRSYSGSSSSSSSQQHFAGGTSFGGSSATYPGSSGASRGGFGSFASHFSGGG